MAELCMCFPEGKHKALTLSYDDGVEQDIRLISIMQKYGIKGTFNLNSERFAEDGYVYPEGTIQRRLSLKRAIELYMNSGMEIATHGATHPFLDRLPKMLALKEISDDRRKLEDIFQCFVRGHAYPYGTFSDEVVEILRVNDIVYARTTISSERFDMPKDWLRLEATCHHQNPQLFQLADQFLNTQIKGGYPMLFYLWGHSYEFEKDNNWERIEQFCEKMGGRDNIWYATNIEIYDYTKAFEALIFNYNHSKVYNPTIQTVWFTYNEKMYKIQPGETIDF